MVEAMDIVDMVDAFTIYSKTAGHVECGSLLPL